MRLLSKAGIIFDKVLNIFAFLAGLMVIFMVLAIPYSVIMRYFFLKPPEWVIQTCEYMLLWLTFLASAWLLRDEGHVSVDFLTTRAKPETRRILRMITSAIGAIICLILTWFAWENTWENFASGTLDVRAVFILKAPFISIIAVGSSLLSIQFIRKFYVSFESREPLEGEDQDVE
jgi:TRAP-type C4-dicarboxylate transport system permease small subunit